MLVYRLSHSLVQLAYYWAKLSNLSSRKLRVHLGCTNLAVDKLRQSPLVVSLDLDTVTSEQISLPLFFGFMHCCCSSDAVISLNLLATDADLHFRRHSESSLGLDTSLFLLPFLYFILLNRVFESGRSASFEIAGTLLRLSIEENAKLVHLLLAKSARLHAVSS